MDILIQVLDDTKRKHMRYAKDFDNINIELLKLKEKIDLDNNIKISVFYYGDYEVFKKTYSKKLLMSNSIISLTKKTKHYGIVISKLNDEKYIYICKEIKEMYKVCYIVEEKYKYVKEYKYATIPITLKDFCKYYKVDFDLLNSLTNETIIQGHPKFNELTDLLKSIKYT